MTAAEHQQRAWTGPVILSLGFRPFFFLGAIWAATAMVIWIMMLSGAIILPTRFDPISWHAHEFLFGYLSAIIAGFLLTAVPNWTGRKPLTGPPLVGLVGLWLAGRVAVSASEWLSAQLVAVIDIGFLIILGAVILREIVAGKNWRNLIVAGMIATFALANFLFHLEAAQGAYAAQGVGLRLGLAAALMMICVIGGRIIPTFTRNWFEKVGNNARPSPPMQSFDRLALLIAAIALAIWVIWPEHAFTGWGFLVVAAIHAFRLLRWKGQNTWAEPLVWILHLGYAFIPLGALAMGMGILLPQAIGPAALQHVWMAGAIGVMTLAVMTRATLGHTGRVLHAGPATLGIYLALIGSVAVRLAAGFWPASPLLLYTLAAVLWVAAYGGFAIVYAPMLLRPKP